VWYEPEQSVVEAIFLSRNSAADSLESWKQENVLCEGYGKSGEERNELVMAIPLIPMRGVDIALENATRCHILSYIHILGGH
jgi:hypothetical protein